MRERDDIVQTAKAIVKQLQPLTNDDTVELLLQRLNDAKRGFPTGGEPPAATDDVDEDGNPTTSAVSHSDRTGQLATGDGRDLAEADRRHLLRTLDQAWEIKKRIGVLMERYGQVHPDNACVECRKVGTLRSIDRAHSATRCRFHAEAYVANNKRDTPPAITDAYLIWGAKGLTDRVLDNNLIVILDAAGNDTGRRVRWQRRKKSKGRDVA